MDSSSEGEADTSGKNLVTTGFVVMRKSVFVELVPITEVPADATIEGLFETARKQTRGKCNFFRSNGWLMPRNLLVGELEEEDRAGGIRTRLRTDAPYLMKAIMVTGMVYKKRIYMYDTGEDVAMRMIPGSEWRDLRQALDGIAHRQEVWRTTLVYEVHKITFHFAARGGGKAGRTAGERLPYQHPGGTRPHNGLDGPS